ncbi:DUF2500 domain-containing protein [Clostridium sp. UBA4548]|uniref:DUF2500 domain-containing protein n=1 Tax=Clostridium sp. UBA4548 TaxID=1946361 RepID=UPI0025BB2F75|nr:DUF2500 domain-containing protein [Clostridium sp. UBA4548]
MDFMFNLFPIFFIIIFVVVIGSFIVAAIAGVKEWSNNNGQPKLTVNAKIVGKRENVTHHNHNNGDQVHHTTSTTYYVTFEVESGDRMELTVSGREYGMLIEGDKGKLHFQGTRYLGFERIF